MSDSSLTDAQCESLAFVGNALAPFFLQDPRKGTAQELFKAISVLEAEDAALAWPFVKVDEAVPALRLMIQGLKNGIATEELTWEYRRLFVGPGKKAAPPWGSVYLDRECVTFGLTCLDLRAWMRAHDIKRKSNDGTPEDHIGLMLALLAWLADVHPELTVEFLREHLLTWSSHFLSQMEESTRHSFYLGLARLTRLTLEGIQRELDIKVAYPRFYR